MNCGDVEMFNKSLKIDDLIGTNLLPILVQCLGAEEETLKFKAACAVGNLVSGIPDDSDEVVDVCIAPIFLKLISSSAFNDNECTVKDLLKLFSERSDLLKYILENDLVSPIVALIKSDAPTSLLRVIARIISHLCCESYTTITLKTILEILPAINLLLDHSDFDILKDITVAVEFLVDEDKDQFVIGSGVVRKLIPLLGCKDDAEVQRLAFSAIDVLIKRSVEQQQLVVEYGILSYFPALLTHGVEDIFVRAREFFNYEPIKQAAVNNGFLKKIIENLSRTNSVIQVTAVYSIFKFVSSSNRFTFDVVKEGAIPPLCELLNSNDVTILKGALACLSNIFESNDYYVQKHKNWIKEGRAFDKIWRYRSHEDPVISRIANSFINKHFPDF